MFSWITDWDTISSLAPGDAYLLPGKPRYLGYIPQKFSMYDGVVASHHRKYAAPLEKGIQVDIVGVLKKFGNSPGERAGKLGEIKDFKQLVASSQAEGVPMWLVKNGTLEHKREAKASFKSIAEKIIRYTAATERANER
jgi:hypothetical protein